MYGNNPLRKLDHGDGSTLHIHSIFPTIQGEGPYAGRSATFVRLHGCHLACTFCDTDFESVMEVRAVESVVEECVRHPARLVVLTGGEPMRQNILPLVQRLTEAEFTVQIETAGSFWLDGLEMERMSIVVSPKTHTVHPRTAYFAKAWKYLISARTMSFDPLDNLPICNTQNTAEDAPQRPLARPPSDIMKLYGPAQIFLQPMDEGDEKENAVNVKLCVELCLRHGYSLSLQQHKLIGVP